MGLVGHFAVIATLIVAEASFGLRCRREFDQDSDNACDLIPSRFGRSHDRGRAGDGDFSPIQATGGAGLYHRGRRHRPAHAAVPPDQGREDHQHPGGAWGHSADVLARIGIQFAQAQASGRNRPDRFFTGNRAHGWSRLSNWPALWLEPDGPHLFGGDAFDFFHHHHRQGPGRSGQEQGGLRGADSRHPHRRRHSGHRDDRAVVRHCHDRLPQHR